MVVHRGTGRRGFDRGSDDAIHGGGRDLADQIVLLDAGRMVASGTADELKDRIGGNIMEVRVAGQADLGAFWATLVALQPRWAAARSVTSSRSAFTSQAGSDALLAVRA